MLILARKSGESIKIGDNITLEIISLTGNTVKIGIEAPKEISILRKELYDMIKNENINASVVLNSADLSDLNRLNSLNGIFIDKKAEKNKK